MNYYTGAGDNPNDPLDVGGGRPLTFTHKIGDPTIQEYYIDFNCVENETWIFEGYLTWTNCKLDRISMEVVPLVTEVTSGTNTNYKVFNNSIILPAFGSGTVIPNSDLSLPNGGLVACPPDDQNNPQIAFWNAKWDSLTKRFVDIAPAPAGNGYYNIFVNEEKFARFVNKFPLLNYGTMRLASQDVDEMGQGIRIKVITETNTEVEDHEWSGAGMFTMHRARTS